MEQRVTNMKNILTILIVIISCLASEARAQQQSGTPSQIRVVTDANGYLVSSFAALTLPLSQPNVFSNTRLVTDANGNLVVTISGSAQITAGTDVTVNDAGSLGYFRYKATVTTATCVAAFKAAATTADCTIATLPAKTKLVSVYADVTAAFTCSGTCTGTKTIGAGKTAGGVEILAAGLNVAATGQFGLADADLGTAMVRAAAIQGGYLNSWTATTPVIVRFTSGTGNCGSGVATYVNAGSITFYLITDVLP